MFAETTAEIIFSGTEHAAVRFETSAPPASHWAAEIRLLTLFAAQVYADVGTKPQFVAASSALAEVNDLESADAFAALPEVAGVYLQPSPEPGRGRVGFAAWLLHWDEVRPGYFLLGTQKEWRLKVRAAWRERRYGNFYFTTSVALLYHHLLRANAADDTQRQRLIEAFRVVAALHREGALGLPTAWTKAVSFACEETFGASVTS